MGHARIWYVAYGSNLSSTRFQRYLDTCVDPDPPREWAIRTLPYRLFFAYDSKTWTGGTAFLEPADSGASTLAVAWSITEQQFLHVLAAENGRSGLDTTLTDLPSEGESTRLLSGRYGLVLGVESPDDRPAYTFTTGDDPLPRPTQPAAAYTETIVAGLRECHGLTDAEARVYLETCGVSAEVGPAPDAGEELAERRQGEPGVEEDADVAADAEVAGDERVERRSGS